MTPHPTTTPLTTPVTTPVTEVIVPEYRKSSRSGTKQCVEAGPSIDGAHVGVRDTKDDTDARIVVPTSAWRAFTAQFNTIDS